MWHLPEKSITNDSILMDLSNCYTVRFVGSWWFQPYIILIYQMYIGHSIRWEPHSLSPILTKLMDSFYTATDGEHISEGNTISNDIVHNFYQYRYQLLKLTTVSTIRCLIPHKTSPWWMCRNPSVIIVVVPKWMGFVGSQLSPWLGVPATDLLARLWSRHYGFIP